MTAIALPQESRHQTRLFIAVFAAAVVLAIAGLVWAVAGGSTTHRANVEVGPLHDGPLVCHVGRPC